MESLMRNSVSLSVRNAPKGTLKKFRSATRWISTHLLGSRLSEVISIHLIFCKDLCKKEFVYGDCGWEDDSSPPRLFTIRIDSSMTRFQQFTTLSHELVHMKQFAKGELYDYTYRPEITRWKRRKINVEKTDYKDLPWEKEAYKLQRNLIISWAKETGNMKFIHKKK